jgi:hypothetical protein
LKKKRIFCLRILFVCCWGNSFLTTLFSSPSVPPSLLPSIISSASSSSNLHNLYLIRTACPMQQPQLGCRFGSTDLTVQPVTGHIFSFDLKIKPQYEIFLSKYLAKVFFLKI